MRPSSRAWIPLAALTVASCTVTETGNPPFAAQMALTTDTSDPDTVALGSGVAPVVVQEAWVSIGDVRFVRASECDAPGETEIDIPGPIVAELAGEPSVIEFELGGADYCRVRVPLSRTRAPLPTGAPAEMLDHSLLVRGERADGTPFLLLSRIEREADVRSRGEPFDLGEARRAVVLAFDVARWLTGVDLDGAEVGADGVIRIDERTNDAQLDAFEANVDAALRLFRDTDEDGALDAEERSELLAEGAP